MRQIFDGIKDNLELESVFEVKQIKAKAKLDQNEFPYDIPVNIKEDVLELLKIYSWNRYPSPELYRETKIKFSENFPNYIKPENIILSAGADELILASMLITKENVQIFEPTYPIYSQTAIITGKKINKTLLKDDFTISPDMISKESHCVFFVSPNTPAGYTVSEDTVEYACKNVSIVVVDEAYFDFTKKTHLNMINKYKNLFIIRTFSKAMGVAAVRLGYGFAQPELIKYLEKALFVPYNMNILTLFTSWFYKDLLCWQKELIDTIITEREKVRKELEALNLNPLPSEGNFITFKGDNEVYEELAKNGVRVRNVGNLPKLSGYLRVTIGNPEENKIFLETLKKCLKKNNGGDL